jgi:tRNA A37 threonylcarbamoyladenosine synthetase subunit TsaC/SUA5/YrdC
MAEIGDPLPTTSINRHGEPPASTWAAALSFARSHHLYAPEILAAAPPRHEGHGSQPSTIVRVVGERDFQMIRPGALASELLRAAFD